MPIELEKTRVNLFNVAGFIAMVFSSGMIWASTQSEISDAKKGIAEVRQTQVERAISSDRSYVNIADLQYGQKQQARELEEMNRRIEATNVRVDKFIELINGKLDDIGGKVNDIRIDVGVISGRNFNEKRPARP